MRDPDSGPPLRVRQTAPSTRKQKKDDDEKRKYENELLRKKKTMNKYDQTRK